MCETIINGRNYRLYLLDKELIRSYRDTLLVYIERYRTYERNVPDSIIDDILEDRIKDNVWMIMIDDQLEAVCLTYYTNSNTLFIRALAGWFHDIYELHNFLRLLFEYCKKYAISYIQFVGRMEWANFLKDFKIKVESFYTIEV
ncbi:MAG: hypothetical protein ACREBU_00315 [Nitrososphaera sp.]